MLKVPPVQRRPKGSCKEVCSLLNHGLYSPRSLGIISPSCSHCGYSCSQSQHESPHDTSAYVTCPREFWTLINSCKVSLTFKKIQLTIGIGTANRASIVCLLYFYPPKRGYQATSPAPYTSHPQPEWRANQAAFGMACPCDRDHIELLLTSAPSQCVRREQNLHNRTTRNSATNSKLCQKTNYLTKTRSNRE